MGLFDKKFCDICGEQIKFLGNRKLEDGNMCKDCAHKISPFMTDRRRTSIAEMKEHLAYREANKEKLRAFKPTQTFGESKKVYIDRNAGAFVVSSYSPGNWTDENPDVIPLGEVTQCTLDIDEDRDEIYRKDAEGNNVSYNPKRYKYTYDFKVKILVSNRWFDDIDIQLNTHDVEGGVGTAEYHKYEVMGGQIRAALTGEPMAQTGYVQQQGYPQQQAFPQQQASRSSRAMCSSKAIRSSRVIRSSPFRRQPLRHSGSVRTAARKTPPNSARTAERHIRKPHGTGVRICKNAKRLFRQTDVAKKSLFLLSTEYHANSVKPKHSIGI